MSYYSKLGSIRSKLSKGDRGPPGLGFKLTDDGNFNIENKILKNVNNPEEGTDCSNKLYVDERVIKNVNELKTDIDETIVKNVNELKSDTDKKIIKYRDELKTVVDQTDFKTKSLNEDINNIKKHNENTELNFNNYITENGERQKFLDQEIINLKKHDENTDLNLNNYVKENSEKTRVINEKFTTLDNRLTNTEEELKEKIDNI